MGGGEGGPSYSLLNYCSSFLDNSRPVHFGHKPGSGTVILYLPSRVLVVVSMGLGVEECGGGVKEVDELAG